MKPDNECTCSPLCGATKAYGRFAKWWQHEPECPERQRQVWTPDGRGGFTMKKKPSGRGEI